MSEWTFRLPVQGIDLLRLQTGIFRHPTLSYRGRPLLRLERADRPFLLILPDGTQEHISVRKRAWDPLPIVLFRGERVRIAPPLRWWEWLLILLPLGLAVYGGLLGILIAISATSANLLTMRVAGQRSKKIVAALATTVIACSMWYGIVSFTQATVQQLVDQISPRRVLWLLDSIPEPPAARDREPSLVMREWPPPSPETLFKLRDFIANGAYAAADSLVTGFAQAAVSDDAAERRWAQLVFAVGRADSVQRAAIDRWVVAEPGSRNAHLMRGAALLAGAWRARGAKFASETSQEQFAAMAARLDSATAELGRALRQDPAAIAPYWLLISVAKLSSDVEGAQRALDRALRLSSGSVFSREEYLGTREPKWGGSMAEVEAFLVRTDSLAERYPALQTLRHLTFLFDVENALRDSPQDEQRAVLERALTIAPSADWALYLYAMVLGSTEGLEAADKAIRRAITAAPCVPDYHYYRSRVMYHMSSGQAWAAFDVYMEEAKREIELAVALDGNRQIYRDWRDSVIVKQGTRPLRPGGTPR